MLFERSRSSGSIIEICRHGFFSLRISLLLRSLSCRRSWRSIPLFTDVHLSSTVRGLDYCHQYSIRRQKECKHLLISCLCLKRRSRQRWKHAKPLRCAIPICSESQSSNPQTSPMIIGCIAVWLFFWSPSSNSNFSVRFLFFAEMCQLYSKSYQSYRDEFLLI